MIFGLKARSNCLNKYIRQPLLLRVVPQGFAKSTIGSQAPVLTMTIVMLYLTGIQ